MKMSGQMYKNTMPKNEKSSTNPKRQTPPRPERRSFGLCLAWWDIPSPNLSHSLVTGQPSESSYRTVAF